MYKELMTAAEFIEYAVDATSRDALEGLYDRIAEHNSECAMFGDSGPGTLHHINRSVREVNAIEARLAKLQGREPRDFRFRVRCPN